MHLLSHYGIEDWNQIVDVNLRGVINGIQAAYPMMMKQGFGHITNTASMAGLMPGPGSARIRGDTGKTSEKFMTSDDVTLLSRRKLFQTLEGRHLPL